MIRTLKKHKSLMLSAAVLLALSSGASAQSTAGTTTVADLQAAGYTDVVEVETTSSGAAAAFEAIGPDGGRVTIEIQRGTGEWLVLRHQPRDVVTIYRAGEAPAGAFMLPGTVSQPTMQDQTQTDTSGDMGTQTPMTPSVPMQTQPMETQPLPTQPMPTR